MNRFLAVFLISLFSFAISSVSNAQSGNETDSELPLGMGFLVLKNGHVISGTMTSTDEGVTVNRGNGVAIRFRYSEIDLQVQEFYEAYTILHRRLKTTDVDGHMNLASWCLRLGDVRSASEQIDYLAALRVNEEVITRMRSRLEKKEQANVVQSLPAIDGTDPTDHSVAASQTSEPADELKDPNESLPFPILRAFNSEVQPRLINGCAAAGCHVGKRPEFQLVRPRGPTSIRSGVTKHNLQATIDFIDQENPLESPLLDYMQRSHGEQLKPTYDVRSSQYQLIRNWTFALAVANGYDPAIDLETSNQNANEEQPIPEDLDIPFMHGSFGANIESTATETETNTRAEEAGVGIEATPASQSETDPFDPAIFNRRHGKKVIQTSDINKRSD